jgi:hypothetical protein
MSEDQEPNKKIIKKTYTKRKIRPPFDRFDYWYSADLTAEQTKGWSPGDLWRRAGHEQYIQPNMKPRREHRRMVAEIKAMIQDGKYYLLSEEQKTYLLDACPYGKREHPDEMPYEYVRGPSQIEKRDRNHLMHDPLLIARD